MSVAPFQIRVPEVVLRDLRERLQRTRWPDQVRNSGWEYGTDLSYMKELVKYWLEKYDWPAEERNINRFSHFTTEIDGLRIHFLHEKGKGVAPLPILLTHGWPSTFYEFNKIIRPLADPASYDGDERDAFDVVVPSLTGYGFSQRPDEKGVDTIRIAKLWTKLMSALGYQQFVAHGGDWGADISTALGAMHANHVLGIHINMCYFPVSEGMRMEDLTSADQDLVRRLREWQREEEAYSDFQGTKPQTLGYSLNDSPVGLAAWIMEKFRAWSDCDGEVEARFTKDELLTNIMIYWVTETANSASRIYYEARHAAGLAGKRCDVPTSVAIFPKEPWRLPRRWAEQVYNIVRWVEFAKGGHFPAMEEPDLLIQDMRDSFRRFR